MVIRSFNSSSIYRLNLGALSLCPRLITDMQIYQGLAVTQENLHEKEFQLQR